MVQRVYAVERQIFSAPRGQGTKLKLPKPTRWSHDDELLLGRGKKITIVDLDDVVTTYVLLEADRYALKVKYVDSDQPSLTLYKHAIAHYSLLAE